MTFTSDMNAGHVDTLVADATSLTGQSQTTTFSISYPVTHSFVCSENHEV